MKALLSFLIVPLGRVLLSAIFIASAVLKIMNWEATAERMQGEGMTYVTIFLIGAVAFELLGGLSLLLGLWPRLGALLLLAFLIPATLIFHDFWNLEGQEQQQQMTHFLKNVAILGGLLIVLGMGAGRLQLKRGASQAKADR